MDNPQEVLLNILDITEYSEDKQVFVNRFLQMCRQQAFLDIVDGLSSEQKQELNSKLVDHLDSVESMQKEVELFVGEETYKKALEKASEKMFSDYMDSIALSLSEDQKKSIESYFSSLPS